MLLLWTGGVRGQFADGGDIKMSCGDCDCSGSSDAGTVTVFENPSSGGKVREKRPLVRLVDCERHGTKLR